MKLLIIEDSDYKLNNLRLFFEQRHPGIELCVAGSFQSALKKICANEYNLIVMDMTLPTSDPSVTEAESRIRPFGGMELMREMLEEDIDTPVIVLTQFDQFSIRDKLIDHNTLFQNMSDEFEFFSGGVYYDSIDTSWVERLQAKVGEVIR